MSADASNDKPTYTTVWDAVRAARDALLAAVVLAQDENASGQSSLTHVPFLLQELCEAGRDLTPKLIDLLAAQIEAEQIIHFGTRTPMEPATFDDNIRWPLAQVGHDFAVAATNASSAWGQLVTHTHAGRVTAARTDQETTEA